MKYALLVLVATTGLLTASAQDAPKKPVSPPATTTQTIKSGAVVTINYSQPSVKGRKIGTELEPKAGQVWRTGANKATTFEVTQDVKVNGKALPKGKYGLFTLVNGEEWTIIFNKTWDQWGAFTYKADDDILRVTTKSQKAPFAETLTFSIANDGKVGLVWGDQKVEFTVE